MQERSGTTLVHAGQRVGPANPNALLEKHENERVTRQMDEIEFAEKALDQAKQTHDGGSYYICDPGKELQMSMAASLLSIAKSLKEIADLS